MELARHLKRLAGVIPGIGSYQKMEELRETDRMLRMRLAWDLKEGERGIEGVKRRLMEKNDLSLLPGLDYLAAKIEKLSNVIRYAGQGYRGLFDTYSVDRQKLEQLYAFDLRLSDEVEAAREKIQALAAITDSPALKEAIHAADQALDQLERAFSTRCNLFEIH